MLRVIEIPGPGASVCNIYSSKALRTPDIASIVALDMAAGSGEVRILRWKNNE
jgi:hypothetical protein